MSQCIDLYAELSSATDRVRQAHLDRLWGLGVSKAFIAEMGREVAPVGVIDAEMIGGGLYQPGDGPAHLIIPVLEYCDLIDLCAFRSMTPNSWGVRAGNGWALGLRQGWGDHLWDQPAHVYSNPLDWMQGGGCGLCVLDWGSPHLWQLGDLPGLTVSDPATAALLRDALSRPVRLPEITIMEATRVA